jgi:hypothetical protein
MKINCKVTGIQMDLDDYRGNPMVIVHLQDSWESDTKIQIRMKATQAKPYASIGRTVKVEIKPA